MHTSSFFPRTDGVHAYGVCTHIHTYTHNTCMYIHTQHMYVRNASYIHTVRKSGRRGFELNWIELNWIELDFKNKDKRQKTVIYILNTITSKIFISSFLLPPSLSFSVPSSLPSLFLFPSVPPPLLPSFPSLLSPKRKEKKRNKRIE